MVALVKQQVERALDCWKSFGDIRWSFDIKEPLRIRKYFLRTSYPLLGRSVGANKSIGNLINTETAQDMENQGDLGLLGQSRMAAGEHHAKQVVFDGVSGEELRNSGSQCPLAFNKPSQLRRKSAGRALAPEHIERTVLCGGHQPRRRILRHPTELPYLQRSAEGVLYDVLGQHKVTDSKDARENSDHPPRFTSEQMLTDFAYMLNFMTGRTSTPPSTSKIGQPLESSTACSRSRASISV